MKHTKDHRATIHLLPESMILKILHIAPFNTSGVPITLARAERALGHYSRLVTMGRDRRAYEEDICLDLPLLDFWGTRVMKRLVSDPAKLKVTNQAAARSEIPMKWQPHGLPEAALVKLREKLWAPRIQAFFREMDFWNFDVYQLDGGLGFYRDGRTILELKRRGKKIICCYTGSDLRTRGVIPEIDAISDLNVTLEWDHLDLHPHLQHVLFPFETERFELRLERTGDIVKIGHAPTNRLAKGSDLIIATIGELASEYPVELVLIENLPYAESIKRKAVCHIFVDQLGALGYGLNSLEALAMGIPTCSCLTKKFQECHPDHPFCAVDELNLKATLAELINQPQSRREIGAKGRAWVKAHHDSKSVARKIHVLAGMTSNASSEQIRSAIS